VRAVRIPCGRMRILLSFESLAGFGGTETYTVTVARELGRLGHDAAIYSPNLGAMANFARELGVQVIGGAQLPKSCDLIIASDVATCHELAGRHPDAPVVFVAHSAQHMLQAPPQLSDRCQAVVVLNDRVRRAVEARAWHAPILRLRQPIDLQRFQVRGPGQSAARAALVSTNYVAGRRADLIEEACRANGIAVTWIGATTNPTAAPELAIAGVELVIGLGRSVLEGMAAARAAYVYGVVGGDGWVTPESYPALEADGFAGTSSGELTVDLDRLAADLAAWDPGMGELNRDLASAHHNAREHAIALIDLGRTLARSPSADVSLSDELAHLVRLHWHSEARAMASQIDATSLRASITELELEIAALQAEHDRKTAELTARVVDADARLTSLKSTRRYRFTSRLVAPLDRLRAATGLRR
jgi:uncharacterized small protein (DUF1192 family)